MSNPAPSKRPPRQPLLLRIYAGLLTAGGPLLRAYLRRRHRAGKEDIARIGERYGQPSRSRPNGFLVWFHAASVGESMSMLRLIERVLDGRPATEILVTTGTVTSAKMVADRLGDRVIHQYVPVDRPSWVEQFLDHWHPDCAIWIESEIWPSLLQGIAAREIPAALVNARMSATSHARWMIMPAAIGSLLATFDVCLAQTEQEVLRLGQLGARDVKYVGHLKYAADALPADPKLLAELKAVIGNRPLWVLASSHEGEEDIAIDAHRRLSLLFPDLLTVIVPRHTGRSISIAQRAAGAGLAASLRSGGLPPSRRDAIYIVDSMGELGLWYRLTPIACIGGSLTPIGGHNPIEAAQLGCALLYGPHMHNTPGIAAELEAAGAAFVVHDAESLAAAIARLIEDRATAQAMAAAAREVAEQNRHVIDRAFAVLGPLIDHAETRRNAA
jgi:3-deoxy-D-manno-octulosonic-acid transferase